MEKMIANQPVVVNEEGYLENFSQWTPEIAEAIAEEEGVGPLNDRHWAVIKYLQEQFKAEVPLTIRKVGKSGVTDIKEFYELFPGGPLKKATKIAGIKKPVGCI
jgi:TusE/DsrC/DsvC family sulfur relay protein